MVNFFIDMDGVTCAYSPEKVEVSEFYKENFFANLKPHPGNIKMIKSLIKDLPCVNFYILSSLLADSPTIEPEKNGWLDKYLPEIKKENRLFVPEGIKKNDFISEHIADVASATNFLLDDYTVNLKNWKNFGFIGIKVVNNINNTQGNWIAENPEMYVNYRKGSKFNVEKIKRIIEENG